MRVVVSGSTGLVGSALVARLREDGHEVLRLARPSSKVPSEPGEPIRWNVDTGELEGDIDGVDAIVHLAGDSIADGRWTAAKKQRIRKSRIDATERLVAALARLDSPPKAFLCASAIGYYGDRGDAELDEDSAPGDGFLPELCQQWEAAIQPLAQRGTRLVNLRIGVVLSKKGGALAKMLPPFKLGGGGKLGSGRQYMSWIALDDVVGAIRHALTNDTIHGPVNVVAPNPVTNAEFTKALGKALHRPTFLSMPSFAVKLAFGQMGTDLLLASARVRPTRLAGTGYEFAHPTIDEALAAVL